MSHTLVHGRISPLAGPPTHTHTPTHTRSMDAAPAPVAVAAAAAPPPPDLEPAKQTKPRKPRKPSAAAAAADGGGDGGECPVCASSYGIRPAVAPCGCVACHSCMRRWILGQPNTSMPCAQCGKTMTTTEAYTTVGVEWMRTKFRDHHRAMLGSRLAAAAPDAVDATDGARLGHISYLASAAAAVKTKIKGLKRKRELLHAQHDILLKARGALRYPEHYGGVAAALTLVQPVLQDLRAGVPLRTAIEELRAAYVPPQDRAPEDEVPALYGQGPGAGRGKDKGKGKNKRVAFRCPVANCVGYVLGTGQCTVCLSPACVDCHEPIDIEGATPAEIIEATEAHECAPDTLQSVATIAACTTCCPHCATPIQRSEGCPQMYCTLCGGYFDYNSGRPLSGLVHNPEAIEALAARSLGIDIGCGRHVVIPHLLTLCEAFNTGEGAEAHRARAVVVREALMDLLREHNDRETPLTGAAAARRRRRAAATATATSPYTKLQQMYIAGALTEAELGRRAQVVHRRVERASEWALVETAVNTLVGDLLATLQQGTLVEALARFPALVDLMAERIALVRSVYNCIMPVKLRRTLTLCERMRAPGADGATWLDAAATRADAARARAAAAAAIRVESDSD